MPSFHRIAMGLAAAFLAGWMTALACPAAAQDEAAAPAPAQAGSPDQGAEAPADEAKEADLAKKLANPVASLISVPFQGNADSGVGPAEKGSQDYVRIQPVIPFSISKDWNLISRTITPVMWQQNVYPGAGHQFGLNDTTQSLFLSPARPGKLIWGVGPAMLIPTGTSALLSTGKWSAGPTFVVLTQFSGWTAGLLSSQLWSFAGNSHRAEVNQLYFQPFLSYTTKAATSYGVSTESNYVWANGQFSMPIIATVGQVGRLGGQLFQLTAGLKYWAATTPTSPHGFGGRLVLTLLYPRR